jgi:hypothetical protein
MEKGAIEQLIRSYVRENKVAEPGAFTSSPLDSLTAGRTIALTYWDHRTPTEIKRDNMAMVTEQDYISWVQLELLGVSCN